jgi:glycolate oxidase FAD binding subunit
VLHADALAPRDERDVCEAVAVAAASGEKLEIVGGGTKHGIGAPDRHTRKLSMAGLSRVIAYDPAELVLTVEPGVRLGEIEALLAKNNQMLAFEPYDFAETTGGAAGGSTVGGVIGAGLAGSRHISAGGVRDHVLGFSAVNGRGEAFKSGGRVVKNVTGYDLSKLMAGSWGQLAALTQITLRVLPRPAVVKTLALHDLTRAVAIEAMGRAMRAPADVAAASHDPDPGGGDASITAIRVEGFGPSVDARIAVLSGLLRDLGQAEVMDASEADEHWRQVHTASCLVHAWGPVLWRIVVPQAQGAAIMTGIEALGGRSVLDWAGGLVWARTPLGASAPAVRALAEKAGGHAMLADGPEAYRTATSALHPEPSGVAALSRRVREAFDPLGVFDPLRFAGATA